MNDEKKYVLEVNFGYSNWKFFNDSKKGFSGKKRDFAG